MLVPAFTTPQLLKHQLHHYQYCGRDRILSRSGPLHLCSCEMHAKKTQELIQL